jgi:hypothetical protein
MQPIPVNPDASAAKSGVVAGLRVDMAAVFRCYQVLGGGLCPLD